MQPAEILKMVHKAIEKLATGKTFARIDLFESTTERNLQRKVLDRLLEEEIISKSTTGPAESAMVMYRVKSMEDIKYFISNQDLLIKLIWPKDVPSELLSKVVTPSKSVVVPPTPPQPMPAPTPVVVPTPPPQPPSPLKVAPAPPASSEHNLITGPDGRQYVMVMSASGKPELELYVPKEEEELTGDALIQRMVVLLGAQMESIIYMRDKIDLMETEIKGLRKDLGG